MQILKVQQFIENVSLWSNKRAPFIDFETNAVPAHEPGSRVVCVSITGLSGVTNELETIHVPLAHREGENAEIGMVEALANFLSATPVSAFWVQSEAPYTLSNFKAMPVFHSDPYIALRMMQDTQTASMKDASEKYLNVRMTRIEEVLPPGVYDFSYAHAQDPKAIAYSEQDSYQGARLDDVLKEKIEKLGMMAVYFLEVKAAAIMARQSHIGYEMDLNILAKELDNEQKAMDALEADVFTACGVEPFKLNSGAKLGVALGKVGIYCGAKTAKGNDSWAAPVLEGMLQADLLNHDQAEIVKKVLDWKSRFSVRNTLRKSPARVSSDGKIHPTWKSIGYDGTARMYAEDPSITSLPKACRRAMHAPAGKRWMKWDYMQAEIRALAAASQDGALIAALNSGEDFHSGVFSRMKGIPLADVTPQMREASKVISFSILYSGGSPFHVTRDLGIPMEEAIQLVRDYFDMFPKLREKLDEVRSTAVRTRRVRTFMNRLRRLDAEDEEKIRNQASDALGQQSIGTALKIAIGKMVDYHELGHPLMKGLCQIIPVFDAVFYCIDKDVPVDPHIDAVKYMVELNMAGVILKTEFEVGPTWGDLRKGAPGMMQTEADLSEQNVPRETLSSLERLTEPIEPRTFINAMRSM